MYIYIKLHIFSLTGLCLYISDNVLQPISLDFHLKENRLAHHTNEYGVDELIVRRGQSFFISVTFDRVFNPEFDKILFQFSTGNCRVLLYN